MNPDNLVKLYFPLPPTPINIALPLGYLKTLEILKTCSIASLKKINFYYPFPSRYSSYLSSKTLSSFFVSLISSYSFPKSSLRVSPNLIAFAPKIYSFSDLLLNPLPKSSIIKF